MYGVRGPARSNVGARWDTISPDGPQSHKAQWLAIEKRGQSPIPVFQLISQQAVYMPASISSNTKQPNLPTPERRPDGLNKIENMPSQEPLEVSFSLFITDKVSPLCGEKMQSPAVLESCLEKEGTRRR